MPGASLVPVEYSVSGFYRQGEGPGPGRPPSHPLGIPEEGPRRGPRGYDSGSTPEGHLKVPLPLLGLRFLESRLNLHKQIYRAGRVLDR